jgi:hypothetical protein
MRFDTKLIFISIQQICMQLNFFRQPAWTLNTSRDHQTRLGITWGIFDRVTSRTIANDFSSETGLWKNNKTLN